MSKIHVYLASSGSILGTAPSPGAESNEGTTFVGAFPVDQEGFKVVEVDGRDLTDLVSRTREERAGGGESVDSFHQRLAEMVHSRNLPEIDDYLSRLRPR